MFIIWVIVNTFPMILGNSFRSLGCWKDTGDRAITGGHERLGDYGQESAILACFEKAKGLGYDVFAIQAGNACFTSATAEETYQKHGPSESCPESGTGGDWINAVYKIGKVFIEQTRPPSRLNGTSKR